MDILASAPTLPSTSGSISDVTDVVTSLPFDKVGGALGAITPDLDDVSDFATIVARRGSRFGVRAVRTTVRTVRHHPQRVAGVLAALIVLVAVGTLLKRRDHSSNDTHTAPNS